MNNKLFEVLLESVKQGAAILRGEAKPSRNFKITVPDVKRLHENYQLTQSEFAAMLGIGIATLCN